MDFVSVDLDRNMDMCISFRRDAHIVSYGSDDAFDINSVQKWFEKLGNKADGTGFYHVFHEGKIIGQLEFESGLKNDKGELYGYIYLIYLKQNFRNQGLGIELQDFVFSRFKSDGCKYAELRYLAENSQGKRFYTKHGWQDVGQVSSRGQLSVKRLI
ncbi:GNAT family N-acetyltransferase [Vibrio sp. YMD68]|uniref:GNAT family N-acetyltransferase n=1 Tax=Vibrio sp. YMD68 TaxID=3042300 RepID=UPI00249A141F|nr:GNAT family N-acetyltransferase [Vibrio sp. YMD68]WGV98042.1 GNAT family N-acetyltransferase [Vibrio sp. YMD68]